MMLLSGEFNLFTQPGTSASQEDLSSVPTTAGKDHDAALEVLTILKTELLASDGSLHPGTALYAAAWLTGTSLHRSFHFEDKELPGTLVPSDKVNTAWEGLMYLLEQYNFSKAEIPIGRLVLAAMGAPRWFRPQVEMIDVQSKLQEQYNTVMKKYGFDYLEGARVGIILCSMLIQQYSRAGLIDSDAAMGVVAQGIFEAARTVPPALTRL